MSFFPPIPAVLAIAALNSQRSRRPQRPKPKTVPALPAADDDTENSVPVITDATVETSKPKTQRRARTMSPQVMSQRANALSDIAMYMGGSNPRAAQMAQTFKVMSMLNQPAQAQVQAPMTQQERTMGLLRSVGSLMGGGGNMPPILNLLTGAGGGGGIGNLLNIIGGAKNLGPLMSMLGGGGRTQKSGVQPLPANMMDRVNNMLAGMDEKKKEDLLNMARSLLPNSND